MKVNIYTATYVIENVSMDPRTKRRIVNSRTPQANVVVAAERDEDVRNAVIEFVQPGKGDDVQILHVANGAREVFLPSFAINVPAPAEPPKQPTK